MSLRVKKLLIACLLFPIVSYAQESKEYLTASWDTNHTSGLIARGNQLRNLLLINKDSALRFMKAEEAYYRSIGFNDGIGLMLAYQGDLLIQAGKTEEGMRYLREGIFLVFLDNRNKNAIPSIYNIVANNYLRKGYFDLANEYYHHALHYFQFHLPEDRRIAAIYGNLSIIQERVGNRAKALQYNRIAVERAAEMKDTPILTGNLINLGNRILAVNGNSDSAMHYYRTGLDMARKMGYTALEKMALTNIGGFMLERGNAEQAIPYFLQSIQLGKEQKKMQETVDATYGLSMSYLKLNRLRDAEKTLLSAIELAEQNEWAINLPEAHGALSDIYEQKRMYGKALEHKRIHEQMTAKQINLEKARMIYEMEYNYNAARKDKIIAENRLKISQQTQRLERNRFLIAGSFLFSLLLSIIFLLLYQYKRKIARRKVEIENMKARLEGEEMERKRIARELHDGVGGLITCAKLNLVGLRDKNSISWEDIEALSELLQEMGNEVHSTAHNLMANLLDELDLCQALLSYCGQIDAAGKMKTDVQVFGDISEINKETALGLYRITQELVQNALKYADATLLSIQIRMDTEQCKMYLSVEDNGKGYDISAPHSGMGLKNIQERVKLLNGFISVESAASIGTTVFIQLNLSKTRDKDHEYIRIHR